MDLKTLNDLLVNPPTFCADRILLWVTGSINAALVPYWLNWLRQMYPNLIVHALVTRSAERFVSIEALRLLVTGDVWKDSWDEPTIPTAPHIAFDAMADCYGVFPATLDSTMRLASGAASSPMLMALQATTHPIAIAPSFPATNPLIDEQLARLNKRPNVRFVESVPAFSVGKGGWSGETSAFMPLLLKTLAECMP